MITLHGKATHGISDYYLDTETNKTYNVINHTCGADAEKIICNYIGIDYAATLPFRLKRIYKDCKAHIKYFNPVKTR